MKELKHRIMNEPLCVIGLGYVGLTSACAFANAGLDVIGLDTNQRKVEIVNAGNWPLDPSEPELPQRMHDLVIKGKLRATPRYRKAVKECFAFIIAVPTPVYDNGKPNYERLEAAVFNTLFDAEEKKLILIASTVGPTKTKQLAEEAEETEDLQSGWFAHVPERLSAGKLWHNFHNLPRVIGGLTPDATDLARFLYELINPHDLMLTDALTAEIVKTAENAYRDVQIAFAHELSWIAEYHDVDFWQVRQMVNTAPERNVHYVSAGVGGHCLSKDGLLLTSSYEYHDRDTLIHTAREINEFQPLWIAMSIKDLVVKRITDKPSQPTVLLLGTAYKAETSDTRNSPAYEIGDQLRDFGLHCTYHDPYVGGENGDWMKAVGGKDAIVFVQPHKCYLRPDWGSIRERMIHPVVVDCTGLVPKPPDDFTFWRIGSPIRRAR